MPLWKLNNHEGAGQMADILIVSGDGTAAEAAARVLIDAGHGCGSLTDGDRALALLKWRGVDLLLLDEELRGLSGAQVLRELRGLAISHETPVILFGEECNAPGAQAYLSKPIDAGLLPRMVKLLLDARAARPMRRARA